jgi:RNA polymerase sigma-70 factor (ECF subfamily)
MDSAIRLSPQPERRQYLALRSFYKRHELTEEEVVTTHSVSPFWRGLTFEEWRRLIGQGLATLNPKQRKTLELACFEGLLLNEIADRTNESLPNVRHHYYRGLDGLRKFLRNGAGAGGRVCGESGQGRELNGEVNDAEP